MALHLQTKADDTSEGISVTQRLSLRADVGGARYSPAVRVSGEGLLEISGLAAWNEHGNEVFAGDLLQQTTYVLDTLMEPILRGAGAGFDDVARLSVFTTAIEEWPPVWGEIKSRFNEPPAVTVVKIEGLVGETGMVELEISASTEGPKARSEDPQEVRMTSRESGSDGAVAVLPKELEDRDWKLHAAAFVVRGGDLVLLSGLGPVDEKGNTVGRGDAGAQTRQILKTMDTILREAGGSIDDVIRVRVFATDMKNRPQINAERMKTFKEPRAVSTFIQVSGLEDPDWLVAFEATAYIPKRST
jgi:enamine deaminase RidA (YjgF/YER057c/UK114 family)